MNLKTPASPPDFLADGLSITAAEPWFKVKVQVIQSYLQAFIMNALPKADEIIFVDLFSGSGLFSMGHQKEVFAGAGLTALAAGLPFRRWIFCEADPEQARVLDKRVKKIFPEKDVIVLHTSPQDAINSFDGIIPLSKAGRKIAVLCLVDPFSMVIPLDVVNKLAATGFSFLIPFTFALNKRIDCRYYSEEQTETLKKFIGPSHYERLTGLESNFHFYRRLVRLYQNNMLVMGLNAALSTHRLDSRMMELPAYYIGFFSKQFSALAIQREVNGSEHFQYELF